MESVYQRAPSKPKPFVRKSIVELRKKFKKVGHAGLLSCYETFPKNMRFENQEEGEEVILFLRQHVVVMVPWIVLVLVALTIPSVFEFFPPYTFLPGAYQFVMVIMWYLFVVGYAIAKFMGWFFNIYILTDERIVDIDFVNVLYRKISTAKIEDIQDVNLESSGALQTFFHYGNITIQTAAEVPEFEFHNIPNPDKVAMMINQMVDLEEQEKIEGRVK